MLFDKSRIYTVVNAEELKPGDKVIVADDIATLKRCVTDAIPVDPLFRIEDGAKTFRFTVRNFSYALAYLVERKENCTNCGNRGNSYCSCFIRGKSDDELSRTVCGNYIRLSEPKTEKKCEDCKKAYTDYPCVANVYHDATGQACKKFEAESYYRSFKDIDELVKVWYAKVGIPRCLQTDGALTMPLIWVRHKEVGSKSLITDFVDDYTVIVGTEENGLLALFDKYTFLDGSPCGVEE